MTTRCPVARKEKEVDEEETLREIRVEKETGHGKSERTIKGSVDYRM